MITVTQFMDAFNDDEFLNQLSPDDRVDIFLTVLTGSSDITKGLLTKLLEDYCVDDLEITEV